MKILAPINSADEISLLCKAGAEEFFCGYVPESWLHKYNKSLFKDGSFGQMQISINKRDGINQNITDIMLLKAAREESRKNNCKLYITLNYLFYPEEAYVQIKELLEEIKPLDIDGIIVTDVGLIQYLNEYYPEINIILSTCQSVSNSLSAKFFENLGVKRITFPRHISLDEVINITNAVPDIEYECFILEGKCIYDDGNCKALHSTGNFCCDQWEYSYFHTQQETFDYNEIQKLCDNENSFKKWTKPYPSVNTKINGWPYVGCAICAIPMLIQKANITTLKLSGRGASLGEKVALVRFVSKAIKMAIGGKPTEEIREYGKKVLGIPEMCELRNRCYLPVIDKAGD